jgi:hypothetical protein
MLNLPNLLTICRILLVPPLVVVLLTKFDGKEWWGLGLFLLASLMDFLDGYLARRRKEVTRLGTLLDPAADKILISAAFISLVEMDPKLVPSWIVVVIIAREFAVTSLRSFASAGPLGQDQDDRADHLDRAAHHPQPDRAAFPSPGPYLALGGPGDHHLLGHRVLRAVRPAHPARRDPLTDSTAAASSSGTSS